MWDTFFVGILHKILGVITIITSVFGLRIVMSDKNTKQAQILLASADKCCYNRDNLVHSVRRLGDPAKVRFKKVLSYFFLLFEDMGQAAPRLAVPFVRLRSIK